jgi:hypothetical protein
LPRCRICPQLSVAATACNRTFRPIYGLIFLFKWQKEEDGRPVAADYEDKGVFFASQVGGRGGREQGRGEEESQRPWKRAVFGFGSHIGICDAITAG